MNNADYKLSPANKNDKRLNVTPHFYTTAAVLIGGLAVVISTPAYADLNTSITGFKSIVGDVKQVLNNTTHTADITASGNRSIAEWTKLNTQAWEKINFILPNSKASFLGRITGAGSTNILGSISLPNGGHVFLVNPAGFILGKNTIVDTGSLVFSKYDIDPQKFYKEGLVQLRKAGMQPGDSVAFAYPADGEKFSNGATVYLNEDGGLTAVKDTLELHKSADGQVNTWFSNNINTNATPLAPITNAEKLLWDQVPEKPDLGTITKPEAKVPEVPVETGTVVQPPVDPVVPPTPPVQPKPQPKPQTQPQPAVVQPQPAVVEKPTSKTPNLATPDDSGMSHTNNMQQSIVVKDDVLYLEQEQEFQILDSGNDLISYKVIAHDDSIALTRVNAKDTGDQSFADLVANVNQHASATDKVYADGSEVVLGMDKPAPKVAAKPKPKRRHVARTRPRVTPVVAVRPTPKATAPVAKAVPAKETTPVTQAVAKPAPTSATPVAKPVADQAQAQTPAQVEREQQIKEIKQAASSVEKSITEYTAGKKISQTIKSEPIPNAIFKLRQRARQLQQQRKHQQQSEDSSELAPTPADHTPTSADASASKVISFDYSSDLAEVVHKVKKS